MKATVKQIAAGTFIALILMVGNVKAEGTEIKASNSEIIETTLQLENWMTDETIWNTNSLEFVQETEASLELENWMTNAESSNINSNLIEDAETESELEDWMTDDATWIAESITIEPELTVEPWMLNNNIWE